MPDRDTFYMKRCLRLAEVGRPTVSPNPMVGAVIVARGRIIGEGMHLQAGGPHAEVNALASVKGSDRPLLAEATLYVNLEPCHHQGKTPPCTLAIREAGIKRVVIAGRDPNPLVSGKGVGFLREIGVEVTEGILHNSAEQLNAAFLTYHRKKRPYIILKWAESDDFIMGHRERRVKISNSKSDTLVHLWRSEVDAILIGTNTAIIDNPSLTVRHIEAPSPHRILLDKSGRVPKEYQLFVDEEPLTIITEDASRFGALASEKEAIALPFEPSVIPPLLHWAYEEEIQSILIEGGRKTLQSFINSNYWDEARIIHAVDVRLGKGLRVPKLKGRKVKELLLNRNRITFVKPL